MRILEIDDAVSFVLVRGGVTHLELRGIIRAEARENMGGMDGGERRKKSRNCRYVISAESFSSAQALRRVVEYTLRPCVARRR